MIEEKILGVSIARRIPYEVIEPEDFNNKKLILLEIIRECERIVEEVGGVSEEVKNKINKIRRDVEALPTVAYGDYVSHEHHNSIVDILKEIAELLQILPIEKVWELRGITYEPTPSLTLEVWEVSGITPTLSLSLILEVWEVSGITPTLSLTHEFTKT